MEWNPLDKTVKLTGLGIKQGQEYAQDAHVVFYLSYSQENSFLQLNNRMSMPDKKTGDQWVEYVNCIVYDPNILYEITEVIKANCLPR